MSVSEEKRLIRQELRRAMDCMNAEEKLRADEKIIKTLTSMPEYRNSDCIFCFVGTKSEVNTLPLLLGALNEGKRVCVPLCIDKGVMLAKEIKSLGSLRVGSYGILEPTKESGTVLPEEIELSVIPCLGCDRLGHRLGRGGGYYDRFLEKYSGKAVLICYESLIREYIPSQRHDVTIHTIVTEKETFTV